MSAPVVGRFAPTPSGRLHLGNLLCALIAYLSVRHRDGRFLLRIEDLDKPRCPRRLCDAALSDLTWLGLIWDEPPLVQSERTELYQSYFDMLDEKGLIYPCFCTRAQLHAADAPNRGDDTPVYGGACARLSAEEIAEKMKTRRPAYRLRVPDETVAVRDRHYGLYAENLAHDCGDFILRRSDGLSAISWPSSSMTRSAASAKSCAGTIFFPPRRGRFISSVFWVLKRPNMRTSPCWKTRRAAVWPNATAIRI